MNNRGATLLALQRYEDALLCLDLLLAVKPDFVEALNNRAATLRELGRIEEAIESVDRALSIDPKNIESNWHRSMLYLLCGDLPKGFARYERRWERGDDAPRRRASKLPLWLGQENLHGKTILVWGEQGLGDQIMMARYAPLLANQGATVLLEVDTSLIALFRTLKGVTHVGKYGEFGDLADLQCQMMSLPLAFGTNLETIPNTVPYFSVPAGRLAHWEAKLGPKTKTRIGVMWSGGTHAKIRKRSISLVEYSSLFTEEFEWISLQKDVRDSDQDTLKQLKSLRHFGEEQEDFLDAAALCKVVDLVITVDTSMAHLAGALARPTWVLLPISSDWRWLTEGESSPWYPSARLFRQRQSGAWAHLLDQVRSELSDLLTSTL